MSDQTRGVELPRSAWAFVVSELIQWGNFLYRDGDQGMGTACVDVAYRLAEQLPEPSCPYPLADERILVIRYERMGLRLVPTPPAEEAGQ